MSAINRMDAFQIGDGKQGEKEWKKIGIAFQNRDGSFNVFLDAFPKDGRIQLRPRTKKERGNNDAQ